VRQVFVDTLYWIARITPGDPWYAPSRQARAALGSVHLVTTEEVLLEVLSAYSGAGSYLRGKAVKTARLIMTGIDVTVMPQTHQTFMMGLDFYESRADKAYSIVDCISMNTMRQMGITEVLTNDHHFTQEGFTILIKQGRV
jgi:predicted nucleic acid-binding protein